MAPYDYPSDLIAGSVVMWVITATVFGLRMYSVKWMRQNFTFSEWLISAAFVLGTGLTVMKIHG